MKHCLVCGTSSLIDLCSITNVPKAAQYFLESSDIDADPADSTNLLIQRCPNCTHVQQSSSIVSYHLDVITASSLSPLTLQKRDLVLDELVSKCSSNDPFIIEVGAYRGQYINYLLKRGFSKVIGLEHGLNSVINPICPINHIVHGHVHELPHSFIAEYAEACDILLCFNFLEHSIDPHLFMSGVTSLLKKGAYVYFTMPSVEYILRESLIQEFVADHVSYFTFRSLTTLFGNFDLVPISLRSINNDNDLEIVAQYSPGNRSNLLSSTPFDQLIYELNTIIDNTVKRNHKVAFWGAGHRSLTLISQINYSGISFVVDSASFKQNRYTPVSRLPIVSPNYLMNSDIDTLILSLPGVYNIEVAHDINTWPDKPSFIYSILGNQLCKLE